MYNSPIHIYLSYSICRNPQKDTVETPDISEKLSTVSGSVLRYGVSAGPHALEIHAISVS